MNHINGIRQEGYPYHFPTIDFKFQNIGSAAAVMWQFAVSVLYAEIDLTPELSFEASIENFALQVDAINNGWGEARDCQIEIDEPILSQIFTEQDRQYRGTIPSGKKQKILYLTRDLASPAQFEAISNELAAQRKRKTAIGPSTTSPHAASHMRPLRDPNRNLFAESIHGIEVGKLCAKWSYRDERGNKHQGEKRVSHAPIVLTTAGFEIKSSSKRAGVLSLLSTSEAAAAVSALGGVSAKLNSDGTYISIMDIDPSKGRHERMYPIAREIPPGGAERFHIMIGSPVSCHLHIKLKFFVDQKKVIESNTFDIHIRNPRDSGLDHLYKDGSYLSRRQD